MEAALRDSTKSKYSTYTNKFVQFCTQRHTPPLNADVDLILDFLTGLFNEGHSYSYIASAISAISHKVQLPPYDRISRHPMIEKFSKGTFNLRPPKPKLSVVWDVDIIFKHFEKLPTNIELSPKELSTKLVMLLLLLGGQRVNTIKNFHVDQMIITNECITFSPATVLKHSRKGNKIDTFQYRAYDANKNFCIIDCIQIYLTRRKQLMPQNITQLIVTNKKLHKAASTDTIRRWIKNLFAETKAIPNIFTAHSCRAASTSKAALSNRINIDDILLQGCWRNATTFRRFYEKEIVNFVDEEKTPFGRSLLI